GKEAIPQPAEDVVDDRLRETNLGIPGPAGRLETHVTELLDQVRERNAVLEQQRNARGERVHHPGERRALLRHRDEELAGRVVLEEAHGDVALVPFDRELVRERGARVGEAAALRPGDIDDAFDDRFDRLRVAFLVRRVYGLDFLAAVAIDRDRLEAMLPRFDVRLADVVDGRGLRKVHGLRDRARDERLDRAHHLDVAHVVDRAHAVLWLECAIEDGEIFVLDAGRTFDGAELLDVGGDRAGLGLAVSKTP